MDKNCPVVNESWIIVMLYIFPLSLHILYRFKKKNQQKTSTVNNKVHIFAVQRAVFG